jgi:hypothetical protein
MDLVTARAKFATDLAAAFDKALNSTNAIKPVVLVKGPGGLGKSHVTSHLLRHRRVVWFAPTNAALAQLEGFLDAPLHSIQPLVGSGPARPDVEKRIARDDHGACLDPKRIANAQARGLGRFMEREACKGCPLRAFCTYQNWKPSKDWLFAPHARLALDTGDKYLFTGREIAVIDESPLTTMLGGVSFTDYEVREGVHVLKNQPGQAASTAGRSALVTLFEQAQDLLDHPPSDRRRVALRPLVEDLGYHFINRVGSIAKPLHGLGQLKLKRLTTVDPSSVAQFVRLYSGPVWVREKLLLLADALASDDKERPATVLVLPKSNQKGGIAAGHFRPLPVPPGLPVVVLDATADSVLYSCALGGREIITVQAEVDQASVIYQTHENRYPASTLIDKSSPSIDRLMKIVDEYKKKNPSHRVGLILKKGVFEESHVKVRVEKTFALADIKFFWSVRGSNDFQSYDALFVVGAPELSSLDVEAKVRALMSRLPPLRSEAPCNYEVRTLPIQSVGAWQYLDQHGRDVILEERAIEGTLEAYVFRVFHQEEYIQALLRGRPFDPSKKKNIFFLSKSFLTEFEITLVSEAELLGREDLVVRAAKFLFPLQAPYGNQRQLAHALGVSESALSKAKKSDPVFWSSRVAPWLA